MNAAKRTSEMAVVRDRYIELGYWSEALETLMHDDPGFVEALSHFIEAPWVSGLVSARDKHLLLVAMHGTPACLNRTSLEVHMKSALAQGATRAQLLEVLQMVSVVGIHSAATGLPILLDQMKEAGQPVDLEELDERRRQIKEEFISERKFWVRDLDGMLKLCPELVKGYAQFSSYPWRTGTLEPKLREFIYIVLDTVVTHVFHQGIGSHINNALKLGASAEEIAEVFALMGSFGLETFVVGLEALDAATSAHDA